MHETQVCVLGMDENGAGKGGLVLHAGVFYAQSQCAIFARFEFLFYLPILPTLSIALHSRD